MKIFWISKKPTYICTTQQGRLAQLVQSTSFTPRGSGVRTPHRPQKTPIEILEFFFVKLGENYFLIILISFNPSELFTFKKYNPEE